MQWAIGIDGGGTHTRAVLVDREGVVRDMRTGGCGNYQRIGAAGLRALLDDLLPPLLAGVAADGAALCLALAGWPTGWLGRKAARATGRSSTA